MAMQPPRRGAPPVGPSPNNPALIGPTPRQGGGGFTNWKDQRRVPGPGIQPPIGGPNQPPGRLVAPPGRALPVQPPQGRSGFVPGNPGGGGLVAPPGRALPVMPNNPDGPAPFNPNNPGNLPNWNAPTTPPGTVGHPIQPGYPPEAPPIVAPPGQPGGFTNWQDERRVPGPGMQSPIGSPIQPPFGGGMQPPVGQPQPPFGGGQIPQNQMGAILRAMRQYRGY